MTRLTRNRNLSTGRKLFWSILLLALLGSNVNLSAQMGSENFRLSSQALVGLGGSTASSAYKLTSTLAPMGSGMMSADNWVVYGGLVSVTSGQGGQLLAFYSTTIEDTLTMTQRMVKISYGGGKGSISGRMKYRLGGSPIYHDTTLLKSTGDTLAINFPSKLQTIRGTEFYFQIARGPDTVRLGSSDAPFVWVASFNNEEGQSPELTRALSYRMVSLPMIIEGANQAVSVFADDLGQADPTKWRLGSYENRGDSVAEYPLVSAVTNERSFWLITRDPISYGAAGHSVRPSLEYQGQLYYPMPMAQGWNQIANPYAFDIDWQQVLFERSGEIKRHDSTSSILWYHGQGYTPFQFLRAWQGYFFFTSEPNLRLLFPYIEFNPAAQSALPKREFAAADDFDFALQLTLHSYDLLSETITLARDIEAKEGLDRFDRPQPPPPPGYPRLGLRIAEGEPYLWAIDARPPIDSLATWEIEFSSGLERSLAVERVSSLPEQLRAILILDIGSVIELRSDTSVMLPDDSHSAQLLIGRVDYTAQEINEALPKNYALGQNFPNPFNPRTSIRFSLPNSGPVKLVVFNLLGQVVTTLADRHFEAGVHTLTWDSRLRSGRLAASGVYFYRLTTENYQTSKKMLLVK